MNRKAFLDMAHRCHVSNVARWIFYQQAQSEVDWCLDMVYKSNAAFQKHKKDCHENTSDGWNYPGVTPWQRNENRYILVPEELLMDNGDMDEARRTWFRDA